MPGYLLCQSDARTIPLPDRSVQCVVTSPPYFGLRDYGTAAWEGGNDPACDHKLDEAWLWSQTYANSGFNSQAQKRSLEARLMKDGCRKCGARRIDRQIGLEASIEQWVDVMIRVFAEVYRVLRDDGTLWLNCGFSYDGRGNLVDQPGMLKDALVASGWRCKAPIVWHKPNVMPSSQTQRPTISHEMLYLLAKDKGTDYYFDGEAVREPHKEPWRGQGDPAKRAGSSEDDRVSFGLGGSTRVRNGTFGTDPGGTERVYNPAGRNMRSVLTLPTESWPGAHFATYPRKLVEPCIRAGSSQVGCCPKCGAGWVREVNREANIADDGHYGCGKKHSSRKIDMAQGRSEIREERFCSRSSTLAWTPSCQCPPHAPVPCTILDPFAGSGTTLVVANALGRHGIGLDLSREYLTNQAQRRLERPHAAPRRPARVEPDMPLFASSHDQEES